MAIHVSNPMTNQQVLDREYLELRAKILEIAASLDRLDRAPGSSANDDRRDKLRAGISTLLEQDANRAERVQLIFSRAYDADWRSRFEFPPQ